MLCAWRKQALSAASCTPRPLVTSHPYLPGQLLPSLHRFLATRRNVSNSQQSLPQSPLAFVFDIDGVLVRGAKAIPQAHDALSLLNRHKVPFILLTNGGGVSEQARVDFLSKELNINLSPLQIVQSHTPMRYWAQTGKYKRVLVVGGANDNARHVASQYGFPDVVMPIDVVRATPAVSPHHRFTEQELEQFARPVDLAKPVDAVLVFNDPRDMNTDLQIVSDVLNLEGGVIGTKRTRPDKDAHIPSVPIAFSNNDFLWANDYPLPRFGQGAFRMSIETLYAATNGLNPSQKLRLTILGKPFKVQHDYAHWVLVEWNKILHGHKAHGFMPKLGEPVVDSPFSHIYMVGDNPELDIHGANVSGWELVLLRTGVYKDSDWDHTVHRPSAGVHDNVLVAVESVLARHQR